MEAGRDHDGSLAPHVAAIATPASPARLLVTGIPGTGKTTLGRHLEAAHGFAHVDLEEPAVAETFLRGLYEGRGWAGFDARVDTLLAPSRPVVVTWGFVPELQLEPVLRLRAHGFTWLWFDGDREAARRAFVRRGTVDERHFAPQVEKLDRGVDLVALGPVRIDPFMGGAFRPVGEIAREVLALGGAGPVPPSA